MMRKWVNLLNETLNSEMDLHRSFCIDFGITEVELEETKPISTTNDYTKFLIRNAEDNPIEFIAVALLPCQWGYGEIGKNLSENSSLDPESFHYKWIQSYNSREYQEVTKWLKEFVDLVGRKMNSGKIQELSEVFRHGIEFEIKFWESAWLLKSR